MCHPFEVKHHQLIINSGCFVIIYNHVRVESQWKLMCWNKSQKNNIDLKWLHSGSVDRKLHLHCSVWAETFRLVDIQILTFLRILPAGSKQWISFPEAKHVLDLIYLQIPDTEKLKCLMFFCSGVKQIEGNLFIAVSRELILTWNSPNIHTLVHKGILVLNRMCVCVRQTG